MRAILKKFGVLLLFCIAGTPLATAQSLNIEKILTDLTTALGGTLPLDISGLIRQELGKLDDQLGLTNSVMNESLRGFVPGTVMMSTIGSPWSDAYIGQLVSRPPHFGVGGTLGASFLPIQSLTSFSNDLSSMLQSLNFPYLPIPNYTFEARIGGVGVPFDIGFKFGMLPNVSLQDLTFQMIPQLPTILIDYLLVGFDVRISLIKEKKFLPQISVAPSYSFARFGLKLPIKSLNITGLGGDITMSAPSGDIIVSIDLPTSLGFSVESHVMELQVMLSKKLLFIEPLIGVSGVLAISKGSIGFEGGDIIWSSSNFSHLNGNLSEYGAFFPGSSFNDHISGGFRVFGGIGLVAWKMHFDIMGSYEVLTKVFSFSTGFRIQI